MKNEANKAIAILCLFGAFVPAAHAIPSQDVLECALPGSSRAILKARYDWSPLAKVIPADVSERLNQEPWDVAFFAAGRPAPRPPLSVSDVLGSEACRHIGIIDGVPVAKMSYLGADGKWFQPDAIPKQLLLRPGKKSQPPEIRARMEAMRATPALDYALIFPRAGRLVYELPLISIKQGEAGSPDGGASWSEPQITTQAEIYTLGIPPFAQAFQGRAISLNGKPVQADRNVK